MARLPAFRGRRHRGASRDARVEAPLSQLSMDSTASALSGRPLTAVVLHAEHSNPSSKRDHVKEIFTFSFGSSSAENQGHETSTKTDNSLVESLAYWMQCPTRFFGTRFFGKRESSDAEQRLAEEDHEFLEVSWCRSRRNQYRHSMAPPSAASSKLELHNGAKYPSHAPIARLPLISSASLRRKYGRARSVLNSLLREPRKLSEEH